MKFFVFALFIAVAHAQLITPDVASAFQRFQQKFGKQYADANEWSLRMSVFAKNLEKVYAMNSEAVLIGDEATFGITKFMDLTPEEFKSTYLTYRPLNHSERVVPQVENVASAIDWKAKGAVTAVKDQGRCGSCWAFSATEAIESYAHLFGGKSLMKLSPQQITSCDRNDGGCNGGNTETAYQYVVSAGGIETEASYPYTSGTGNTGSCKFNSGAIAVSIRGYTAVARGESNLKSALNSGPVSVCVAADAFQYYTGGVLKSCPGQIDHCVQATGYDDTANTFTLRNSWNTDWGENGYIRLAQGADLCHVADDVTYPKF